MDCRKRAGELHHCVQPNYNCCQSVLVPFVEEMGMNPEIAYRLSAQFGGGMRRGSVCGAVTGGLMALGLLGADDRSTADFQRRFREKAGAMDCAELLKNAKENGEERAAHCDLMVDMATALVDEIKSANKKSIEN